MLSSTLQDTVPHSISVVNNTDALRGKGDSAACSATHYNTLQRTLGQSSIIMTLFGGGGHDSMLRDALFNRSCALPPSSCSRPRRRRASGLCVSIRGHLLMHVYTSHGALCCSVWQSLLQRNFPYTIFVLRLGRVCFHQGPSVDKPIYVT